MSKKTIQVKASSDGKKAHTRTIEVPDTDILSVDEMKQKLMQSAKTDIQNKYLSTLLQEGSYEERYNFLIENPNFFEDDESKANTYIKQMAEKRKKSWSTVEAAEIFISQQCEASEEILQDVVSQQPRNAAYICSYNTDNEELVTAAVTEAFTHYPPSQHANIIKYLSFSGYSPTIEGAILDGFMLAERTTEEAVNTYINEGYEWDDRMTFMIIDDGYVQSGIKALEKYSLTIDEITDISDMIKSEGNIKDVVFAANKGLLTVSPEDILSREHLEIQYFLNTVSAQPDVVQETAEKFLEKSDNIELNDFRAVATAFNNIEQDLPEHIEKTIIDKMNTESVFELSTFMKPEKLFERIMKDGSPEEKKALAKIL